MKYLVPAFLILLFHSLLALASDPVKAPPKPMIVYTDALVDDLEAMLPLSAAYQANAGENLMIVAVDGKVELKAQALHNLMQVLGLFNVTVVAGEADLHEKRIDFTYMKPYADDSHKRFIELLAQHKPTHPFAKAWQQKSYKEETKRFLKEKGLVDVVFIANPLSFTTVQDEISAQNIRQIIGACFSKEIWGGKIISAFNSNANIDAFISLIKWIEANKVKFRNIPSQLLVGTPVEKIIGQINSSRGKIFEMGGQDQLMPKLEAGLTAFRSLLEARLVQNLGLLSDYFVPWDAKSMHAGAWVQDVIAMSVALFPENAVWSPVSMKINDSEVFRVGDQKVALGIGIQETPMADSMTDVLRGIDEVSMSNALIDLFSQIRLADAFEPAEILASVDTAPMIIVGKVPSNDDTIALRALLGFDMHAKKKNIKLVVTESTNTVLSAAVTEKVLAAYRRTDVPVVAGWGQTSEEMKKFAPLKLEDTLFENGLMGKGVLSEEEIKALNTKSATEGAGAKAIAQAILRAETPVDLVVFTSTHDLRLALTEVAKSFPLNEKVRTVHLMGGGRDVLSRNWDLSMEDASKTLELLSQSRVKTYVYSSHLVGGNLTPDLMPATAALLNEQLARHKIGDQLDQVRQNWNRGVQILKKAPTFDIKANYGPPLAIVMATMAALGEKAEQYFKTQPVKAQLFKDANGAQKWTFENDASSSVHMVHLENYGVLDRVTAYLLGESEKRLGWTGRVTALKECLKALVK